MSMLNGFWVMSCAWSQFIPEEAKSRALTWFSDWATSTFEEATDE